MFEVEVDHARLTSGELPPQVRAQFQDRPKLTHLARIKWEEHCTECAAPKCYTSCDLYNPRNDGNCRRTIDGFSPLVDVTLEGGSVVRVKFRRWANLLANCHLRLEPADRVIGLERMFGTVASIAAMGGSVGTFIGKPGLPSRVVRRMKSRAVSAAPTSQDAREPDIFVIEVFNPAPRTVELSLDISERGKAAERTPFRRLLAISPGFHRVRIPFEEIQPFVTGAAEVDIYVNPNILYAEDEGLTLYFGLMTFACEVAEPKSEKSAHKKVKVVIWDLDNTVWDGTLIEDGPGKVTLRPGVREVIEALDARGIVNSVASKNHETAALAELERLGLREFFVFPAIGWGPKSEAVRGIVKSFNVGADTVAFIDDQAFERAEVRAGVPGIRCYEHTSAAILLDKDEFDVAASAEARGRRNFYQAEEVRKQAQADSGADYLNFLRQSNLRANVALASFEQLDRIHELVQRTNQMNFSGTRYTKSELLETLSNAANECYLVDAEDNYGKYGSIGFAVVRLGPVPRVVDMAFSCRVQSKRVEHAVLEFLMTRYAVSGVSAMEVLFRATPKNEQVSKVFSDLDFQVLTQEESEFVYLRETRPDRLVDAVVTVRFVEPPSPLGPSNTDVTTTAAIAGSVT